MVIDILEIVEGILHVNSDVYGMGIIMKDSLDVWCKRYDKLININDINYKKEKSLYSNLKNDMKKLVVQMIETDPDKRPSNITLVHKFRILQKRENKLVKLVKLN